MLMLIIVLQLHKLNSNDDNGCVVVKLNTNQTNCVVNLNSAQYSHINTRCEVCMVLFCIIGRLYFPFKYPESLPNLAYVS